MSQPVPANGSPYDEIVNRYGVNVDFFPLFRVEPVNAREFRTQKINILDFTAIVFSAKTTIDAFFSVCEEMRVTVPETMKYFCTTESIALYLQKHIVYRKRKIFFGTGTTESIISIIGTKHKGENFLVASTDNVKTETVRMFSKAKLKCDSAVFSKTVYSDFSGMDFSKYDMMVFYSPSDVKSLLYNFPEAIPENLRFAAFGPSTAKAMKAAGLTLEIQAPTPEAPSMAKALMLYLDRQ